MILSYDDVYRNLGTKFLTYLNSEQALADLANFIEVMTVKYELPSNTKWIVFGGSYPGSLAAWLRAKYPHLVHGAVSASAPLLAKADFKGNYGMGSQVKFFHVDICTLSMFKKLKKDKDFQPAQWQ